MLSTLREAHPGYCICMSRQCCSHGSLLSIPYVDSVIGRDKKLVATQRYLFPIWRELHKKDT